MWADPPRARTASSTGHISCCGLGIFGAMSYQPTSRGHFKLQRSSTSSTGYWQLASVFGFVADHALDPDYVAGPAAGVTPGVEDAVIGLPVLDRDAFGAGDPAPAVGAEAGLVGQVVGPVGVPPVDAA